MRVVVVYDRGSTGTDTVRAHLLSFSRFSRHDVEFLDFRELASRDVSLFGFDVLVHHYSVRLPLPMLTLEMVDKEAMFQGIKVLFIQDEYDFVDRTCRLINYIGFDWVFTCAPSDEAIDYVYAAVNRQVTQFQRVLTGYADDTATLPASHTPISMRDITIGYRGRRLPLQYGELGQLKHMFPEAVAQRAGSQAIAFDIHTDESQRLYGTSWRQFLSSCRIQLGTPSGSNVFDFDGTLAQQIRWYLNYGYSDEETYASLVAPLEKPGLWNQISPRIFEALQQGSALMLVKDRYSNVLAPHEHYICVEPDLSNLDAALQQAQDPQHITKLWHTAYTDVIASKKWTYETMINTFDNILAQFTPPRRSTNRHWESLILDLPTVTTYSPLSTADIGTREPSLGRRAYHGVRRRAGTIRRRLLGHGT